jgi:hypothetical protein
MVTQSQDLRTDDDAVLAERGLPRIDEFLTSDISYRRCCASKKSAICTSEGWYLI